MLMKIQYIHISDPNNAKIYDTKISLERNPFITLSQEEWDKHELERMEQNRKEKLILEYRVMPE